VEPSRAHYVLADLEAKGYVHAVVTQNIDNLHQKAGSKNVIPVHGTADRFVCQKYHCGSVYDAHDALAGKELVPRCEKCGGILKPDVVLFGENIQNYMDAQESILSAQLLIVIGSSLTVYPLAGFVRLLTPSLRIWSSSIKGPLIWTMQPGSKLIPYDRSDTGKDRCAAHGRFLSTAHKGKAGKFFTVRC
jgi:NAD-dependent deacetylase